MALYRKYRPATFAEVVGQEQVTTPLSAALDAGRINHAYLFSGPRGCGKTSSARIMARSLNCEQGPTSTPCGVCDSCVSLAPGGPGNLDVTELDAASHNGVEDMRELRDRAYYAPAESRYRIFIIDEAHMISASGANALLKVVEEPPEHVIFIFATTEPEKIIGTIRSRTHHYPFRLLTPPAMKGLLERTVASENVHVDDTVYPMVIQAGGGSPRDTLSILDQLLAGAGPDGLTYEVARPLLGVTDVGLLDNTVDALANQDKAGLFRLVDDVIEAGHEPRRFAIDLLDRLRDLMILQAVPSALEEGLVSAPTDRGEVLTAQAQRFSGPQLAYLAETVNERVSSLRGATSPRLLLEILCAHLIVGSAPAAAAAGQVPSSLPQGAGAQPSAPAVQGSAPAQRQPSAVASAQDPAAAAAAIIAQRRSRQAAKQEAQQQQPQQAERPQEPAQPQEAQQQAPQQQEAQEQQPSAPEASQTQAPERPAQPEVQPEPQQEQPEQPQPSEQPEQQEQQPEPEQPQDLAAEIRGRWSDLRATIGRRNKVAEIMLAEARVLGVRDETLVLGHTTGALAERINSPGTNEVIVTVLKEELSRELKVTCVIGTDPKAHGFTVPEPTQRTQWNPNQPQREAAEPDEEAESPAAKEPNNASDDPWGAPRQIGQQAPSSETTKEQPQPQHGVREKADSRPPAEPQRSEAAPRGAAVPPKREARGSQWRSRIAQATQVAAQRDEEFSKVPKFGNGVPLPPEPGPDEGEFEAPPEEYGPPAGANGASESAGHASVSSQQSAPQHAPAPQPEYTRADEEREMMEAAQSAGEMDHRNATEVAMELLAQELGARRL
ncbi:MULTISPECIES: DNA polymerase III subunit gamma and tau [Corynebacterium]|uniref:DNA-directed DNA polymerase n=1 Tax=Corynebacterium intestinale TaxID=2943492 RepID=A0ABT0T8A8_9CORY|nr:DNA polymerase III subunit gamma and tau [Corynebacterium sp. HMSC068H04]MCL8493230.1 DNA polymerase III subunit gamma and tau [Corynebacterium intestinale]MCP1389462.1 DNA polymerase III subunit gamma and tau [Corynebacterium intestinale]OFK92870.1 DNA polymerase III subunit gamma/tau [Corynebacterium sp. HMSC068H04]